MVCLFSSCIQQVYTGSPSPGGDVAVYVVDKNQPSLPTIFYSVLVSVSVYGLFNCVSFHKFSRQLSAFSFCSPSLISALLVLSTIYLFIKVSLNGFTDPARLPFAATSVGGGRDPGDWGTRWLRSIWGHHISGLDFLQTGGWVGSTQSIGWFLLTEYIQLFRVWKWGDCVEVNRTESDSNFMFVCEKGYTSTVPSNWDPSLKGPYLWRYGTHIHKISHSLVENHSSVRKRPIVAKNKMWKCVNRSDYSK